MELRMAPAVSMRLFAAPDEYVIVVDDVEETLRCSRVDGTLRPGRPFLDPLGEEESSASASLTAPVFVGEIHGVIGKIRMFSGWRLVVITESVRVGKIADAEIFRIGKIAVLPLLKDVDPLSDMQDGDEKEKEKEKEVRDGRETPTTAGARSPRPAQREDLAPAPSAPPAATDRSPAHGNAATPPVTTTAAAGGTASGAMTPTSTPGPQRNTNEKVQEMISKTLDSVKTALALNLPMDNIKDRGRTLTPDIQLKFRRELEQRLIRELRRMYDSGCFYYSYDYDLTNSVQRTAASNNKSGMKGGILAPKPLWRRADDRFFWNKAMCLDLIGSLVASRRGSLVEGGVDVEGHAQEEPADRWVLPVVQGYVSLIQCRIGTSDFEVAVISRRSRYRAGTRYRRRGIDAEGNVANFVETEQIVRFEGHTSSFVQIRGSVPVFWTQTGRQYRPLARLDPTKTANETLAAFRTHFNSEVARYGSKVVVVNLLERTGGQETMLCNAFADNVLRLGSDDVTYYEFDFHLHCKGMKYENVSLLMDQLDVRLADMRHAWVSPTGQLLCAQQGVCRTNCLDCLDRTNVVQSAIARRAFAAQLMRFGILSPEQSVSGEGAAALQEAWANNGDAISRQYAGTSAMKSDFTRTGKRNWHGMMNDGYNSLARYFMNNFRDVYRQAVIDLQLNVATPEDILASSSAETAAVAEEGPAGAMHKATEEEWDKFREDSYADALECCKAILVPNTEVQMGGWSLVEVDSSGTERDVILLLTDSAFYVADYSFDAETVESFVRIPLQEIRLIKKGNFSTSRGNLSGLLSSRAVAKQYGFRIYTGSKGGTDISQTPTTEPTSPQLAPATAPAATDKVPEITLSEAAAAALQADAALLATTAPAQPVVQAQPQVQQPITTTSPVKQPEASAEVGALAPATATSPSPSLGAPANPPSNASSPSTTRKTFNSATAAFARLFGTGSSSQNNAAVRRGSAGDLLATSPPSAPVEMTPMSTAPRDGEVAHASPQAAPAPVASPSMRPRSGTKGSLVEHTLRVSVSRTSEDAKVVTDDICDKFATFGSKHGYTVVEGVLERGSNLLQTMNKIQNQIVSKIQSQIGNKAAPPAANASNAKGDKPQQSKLASRSHEDVLGNGGEPTRETFHDVDL